ncbi:MAG TPA: hypothetical protein VEA92_03690 [Candidatus Paceibacterota bacterium]|nr:hypothetical protein [Candidatus Paceibacterota bacterium]
MDTITTPTKHERLRLQLSRKTLIAIGSVAGIAVLLGVLLLIPGVRERISAWWFAMSVPEEVRSFTLIEGQSRHIGGTLVRVGGTDFEREDMGETRVMDYEKVGGVEIAIVRKGSLVEVVTLGESGSTHVSDTDLKSGLSVSADGMHALYARLPNSYVDGDVVYTPDLSMWKVMLLDLATGQERELATGAAPSFLSAENQSTVLFAGQSGLILLDLATGVQNPTNIPVGSEGTAYVLSDDGRYLALYSSLLETYGLYEIYSTDPFAIRPMRELGAGYAQIAFTGDTMYAIRMTKNGGYEVVAHDIASGAERLEKLASFPAGMSFIGFETN